MQSLADTYDRPDYFDGRDPRRIYAGMALLAAGVLALVAAIALLGLGGDTVAAKAWAGLLGGLGVPALLGGIVIVLPASTRERAGVLLGALVTLVGVVAFWHVYPDQWTYGAQTFALETVLVYFLGAAIALWFVFTAIATAHIRNDPGGSVTLELVRAGATETVQVSRDRYDALVSDGGDPRDLIREIED